MILYLTRDYGLETAKAANLIFVWSGANHLTPIIGAILADSYVGKYRMIVLGSILSFLGMVLLWLTAMFPQARPYCDQFSSICESPTTPELLLLYSSLGIMSIGAGGIRSSVGQGKQSEKCRNLIKLLQLLFPSTRVSASSFHVKLHARTSLFTGFAQVLVASFKNRHIDLPSQATNIEVCCLRKGSMLHVPSDKLSSCEKKKNPQQDLTSDGNASNPWSLSAIDQVEELKALIRVMPLCSSGIIMSVTIVQSSFSVIQSGTMDRHITPTFEIPAGSFGMFMLISLVVWIAFYDRIAIPLASKIKGNQFVLV
ncbi:hypothetical protein CRYUN_Cryun02cG0049200 [Craigia yunnanensis]